MNPYAPPAEAQGSGYAQLADPGSGRELEFGPEHDEKFTALASSMRFVGVALTAIGALSTLGGICSANKGFLHALGSIGAGVAYMLQGSRATSAAKGFDAIAMTTGHDITSLMSALAQLRRFYLMVTVGSLIAIASVLPMLLTSTAPAPSHPAALDSSAKNTQQATASRR